MTRVLVFPDLATLSDAAADHIAAWIKQHVATYGRFALALCGGATPRELYDRLAVERRAEKIPWDKVHVFFGDERAVPPDHAESNYRMAREVLLSRVPIPEDNVHRMKGEAADLDQAAREYEQALRAYFEAGAVPPPAPNWPRLDLILLGVGSDGHTASLFPGHPTLEESTRWVVATPPPATATPLRRLTLTLPAINHAAQIILLVSGASKAAIMREILGGQADGKYPAGRVHVHPPLGSTIWMLDAEAASQLGDLPEVKWNEETKGRPSHAAPTRSAAL